MALAHADLCQTFGFTDKRLARGTAEPGLSSETTYSTETNLDTALATADAGYFTATRLAQMTRNDKVYALRLANDPTGI
jgi:hypothetical protein